MADKGSVRDRLLRDTTINYGGTDMDESPSPEASWNEADIENPEAKVCMV